MRIMIPSSKTPTQYWVIILLIIFLNLLLMVQSFGSPALYSLKLKENALVVYDAQQAVLAEMQLDGDEISDAHLGNGFVVVRKNSDLNRLYVYDLNLNLLATRIIGRNESIRGISATDKNIAVEHVTGWTYVYNTSLTEVGKYNEFVLER